ncbi:hypothetical protein ACFSTH_04510 [Paenibacillus yanchengensis]|uniref:Uncharacterized protein n=1 Tax=Paenibacillus yanchengensis TaxID=2035833 RepID=A0ABW4YKC5_9BACL
MEKRLTTTAMLFSVGFIFMIICAVAAFFYGMHIGAEKSNAKYASLLPPEEVAGEAHNYQQQDLVSFYHTVYSPYREFENEWLNATNKLVQGQSFDETAMFNGLAKLASKKAEEARSVNLSKTPLLGYAQTNYIRSLRTFHDAAEKAAKYAKNDAGEKLLQAIEQDKIYNESVQLAFTAQHYYFTAMEKWAVSLDSDLPQQYKAQKPLKLDKWKTLPLTIKNRLVAEILKEQKTIQPFLPQDLTSRIDDFITNGQADKMMLTTFEQIVQLLIDTKAVRAGDFINNKMKYDEKQLLPQLPYFYPDNM